MILMCIHHIRSSTGYFHHDSCQFDHVGSGTSWLQPNVRNWPRLIGKHRDCSRKFKIEHVWLRTSLLVFLVKIQNGNCSTWRLNMVFQRISSYRRFHTSFDNFTSKCVQVSINGVVIWIGIYRARWILCLEFQFTLSCRIRRFLAGHDPS